MDFFGDWGWCRLHIGDKGEMPLPLQQIRGFHLKWMGWWAGVCAVMSTAALGPEPRGVHDTESKSCHSTSTTNEEFHCKTSAIWITLSMLLIQHAFVNKLNKHTWHIWFIQSLCYLVPLQLTVKLDQSGKAVKCPHWKWLIPFVDKNNKLPSILVQVMEYHHRWTDVLNKPLCRSIM